MFSASESSMHSQIPERACAGRIVSWHVARIRCGRMCVVEVTSLASGIRRRVADIDMGFR